MKLKLYIEGMSCMHCVKHVKDALIDIEGVSMVDVNLNEKCAIVEGENLSTNAIKAAVYDAGYEIVKMENA